MAMIYSNLRREYRKSISTPFLIIAVGLVLATSILVGFWQIWKNEETNIAYEDERLSFVLQRLMKDLTTVVEDTARNVVMLAGTPPIQGILTARQNKSIVEIARIEETIWKDRLAQIFLSLAESNRNLLQVRLIGLDGKETIRVNRVGETVARVKPRGLQDKSQHAYVQQTLGTARGKIKYFGIDYNRENGEIEEPRVFVMRVATMAYGKDDDPLGIIVINIDMSRVIAKMKASVRSPKQFLLINENGTYLTMPDKDSSEDEVQARLQTFRTSFPDLAERLDKGWRGGDSETVRISNQNLVARIGQMRFDWSDPSYYLLAVIMTPMKELLAQNREMQKQVILFTALLALFGANVAYMLTRHVVKPLQLLTDAARQLSRGATVDSLKVDGLDRHDEIGVLLRSVYEMASDLEEKQKSMRAILTTAQNPILMISRRGIIHNVNDATEQLFGYSREEMVGQNISMLMNEHDRKHHDSYLQRPVLLGPSKILDGGREVQALCKDGSTVPIHLAVSKLHIKNELFFTGIMTDLTELKKVDKMKSEFVSTVSHELRTPLTSIKGALGLLRSTSGEVLPDSGRKMLDIAYANCERLSVLINDILDMEKIEAGKLTYAFALFDLVPFLAEVIETNRAYAEQAGVSFVFQSLPDPIIIFADRCRMEQVVTNLLSNAVKYSPGGAQIEISADVEESKVRIAVRDHGEGIPEDFHDKIFGKFAQADSSDTRTRGGTGLGLAISREIIKAHSGQIEFETAAGEGTTFFITLDVAPEDQSFNRAHSPGLPAEQPEAMRHIA